MKNNLSGHLTSLLTIIIWGTTFISTKILLTDFSAVEILLIRFVLGLLILYIIYPKKIKLKDKRIEKYFAFAGLCGICLYYLLENISLTYTKASTVGVIISVAPFFTSIIDTLIHKNKNHIRFYIGFVLSIIGIAFVSFGADEIEFNILGDLLALLAAIVWAVYSVIVDKIATFNYNIIFTTRRIFLYGILFMIPAMFIFDFDIHSLTNVSFKNILNLFYLGAGASALCFVTWNYSVKKLGSVKTSVYIYLVPVVTVTSSVIILKEPITIKIIIGTILTVLGLFISQFERKGNVKWKRNV